MKLKPTGYKTAAQSLVPGYLAKRMKEYREKVEAEAQKQRENDAEAKAKVRIIAKVKP